MSQLHLEVQAPFHLEATVRVLQRRPVNRIDRWVSDRYLRVVTVNGRDVLIAVDNRGTLDAPELRCSVDAGLQRDARAELKRMTRRLLGLDWDPQPLLHAARTVGEFDAIALALRGMRPPRFASLFEAFARVIPFQQLSLDAGVSIVARIVERFGACIVHQGEPYFAFPRANVIATARMDSLRRCGLSATKARTLRDIARRIDSGELQEAHLESMSTADALQRLIALPGIGPWSASVVLLRGLGRLDVFPPGDVGAARGVRTVMGLEPGIDIDPIVERFGDCRGYLYFHVLGGSLLGKGLIQPAP